MQSPPAPVFGSVRTSFPVRPSSSSTTVQTLGGGAPSSVAGASTSSRVRRNLYNTASSLLAQVGAILLFLYVFSRIMATDVIFFSGHIGLNNFAVLMMVQSIILVQPTIATAEKQLGATVHGIFNVFGAVCLFGSFAIVVLNKIANGGTHFHSAHARIGLFAYIVLFVNIAIGMTQYWMPALYGSSTRAKSMYKYHRVLGYFALLLSFITTLVATTTDYNKNVLHARVTILLAFVIITAIGLAVRIRPSKFQFNWKSRRQ
ncbi:uncharacterized protein V1518DRAFT_373137 [Limtongia smithiae]|uniref:uncharacterized protein n=1 Tax=Limtongia smithiae TaxID=1125753 RepID=UPI0034CF78BC